VFVDGTSELTTVRDIRGIADVHRRGVDGWEAVTTSARRSESQTDDNNRY
jgi:hypothetical protein